VGAWFKQIFSNNFNSNEMSESKDQFSISSPLLATKLTTLVNYSAEAATVTKLGISAADNTELSGVVTPFVTAENALGNKNAVTKAMTQTRDTAEAKAVTVARKFAPKWYYNNLSADATDILNAGLVAHSDAKVTHEGGVIGMPALSVDSISGHRFDVTVKDSTGSEGKPVNIVFIRVRYFVVTTGLVVPADPADFCKFTDNSRHPIVLTLPAAQAGLPIAISTCYVDAQGNEGPYSNVVTLNIS